MKTQRLRIRQVVGDNLGLVVAGCLLVLLLGGYLTYTTHIDPGVETERVQESSWSATTELTHSATVTSETTVFPEGTVLQDRGAYFLDVAPTVDGTVEYTYRATDGGSLDVQVEQRAVLQSVGGDDTEPVQYWRTEEQLATGGETAVSPGETVEVPYSLNVSEQMRAAEAVEAELGGTPGETELLVVSQLSVSGDRNGVPVTETHTYETTISTDGNIYRFDGEGPHEESGGQFTDRQVEATHGLLRSGVGPLLSVLGGLGLGLLAAGRYRGAVPVSQTEREWLAYRTTYSEFEEWLSTGHVPDDALPASRVTIDSLEELVNVAIDSNRRVVHDRQRNSCLVIVDERAYTYDPPVPPSGRSVLETVGETTQSRPDSGDGSTPVGDVPSTSTADEAGEDVTSASTTDETREATEHTESG